MLQRIIELLENARIESSGEAFNPVEGNAFGFGTTVGNGKEGWAPGAIFVHTDGGSISDLVYVNRGTITTADFAAIPTELGSTSASEGASLVGVEDSAGDLAAVNVETALAELAATVNKTLNIEFFDDFDASALYALGVPPPGWSVIDTSAAGTPTINESADCHGGAVELAFDNQDEAQAIGLDRGDELMYDIDQLVTFECRFRAPTINANDEIVIGMISAQDDAPANLTEGAWISVDGTQDIDCESDDGATREDDNDSGVNLGNDVWCSLLIDFTDTADVMFYLDITGAGAYARVQAATTFDMSNYTGNLQPAMYLTKSGGAQTTNLDVDFVRIISARA